jgi:translation initiation factor IF-2
MAKKRVHEIAKELKAHGIEMDNREVVAELQSLDFDVKSHSSSLDEDQAVVAVDRIVQKRKPKPKPIPVQAAGFVVRRRKVEVPDVSAPAAVAAPPAVAEEGGYDSALAQVDEVAAEVAEAPSPQVPPVAPSPGVGDAAQASLSVGAAAPRPTAAVAHGAAAVVGALSPAAERAAVPTISAPREIREADIRRPPNPIRPASPELPKPASIDPRTLRPTANQAVVIHRPAVPTKRVTPLSNAHQNIPHAPGQRAIGEVRELKVGTDFLGRREFTDVTQDKAGKNKKGKQEIKETLSKQELVDLARGRTVLPLRAGKKKRPTKKGAKTQITAMAEEKKVIKIEETISLADLSKTLGVKASELIKKLMASGVMATMNHMLDPDSAGILAADYGWRVEKRGFEIEDFLPEEATKPEDLRHRPPVVTIMGHVDHGKTSLLDAIREARVAEGEAGGITQHIGAYLVHTPAGKPITFIDTPGHEAFTAMRARGAKVTDVVVIVVAADDGVMPQTKEAISHAKAAEVPILVAINKIDKPEANPQTVKNQLMEHGLVDETLGGDTIMVPVSAKTRQGLPQLLEMILLQAEVLELKANPSRPARGAVVEAKLEKGRGPVATIIVHEGTLRVGDAFVTGAHYGKVRGLTNDRGDKVEEALPGYPVEVQGFSGVPTAGDELNVVESEVAAKEVAEHRAMKDRQKDLAKSSRGTLEELFARVEKGEAKELKLIVKADVQGSAEAVSDALVKLSGKKVTVRIIHSGVGGINESDVMLAAASGGMVVGFNARAEGKSAELAAQQDVQVKTYSIIYEAVDEVRTAMEGLLEPTLKEKALGRAEVRSLFTVPKLGIIAGCAVVDGKIVRSAMVRLLRDNKPVHSGKIASLKRFKDDVREVASGFECGLSIENCNDIKAGDVIEAFEIEEIRQSLQ